MKIALSSMGKDIESDVSDIFARCPYFVIADIKDQKINEIEVVKNEGANQMGGAGISMAQLMAEKDVKAVITGNVGPRAFEVLKQFNIEIYRGEGKVKEAIGEFVEGKLEKLDLN
jgi:predicted Fe-Mo cluster-binding NifX family protein